MKALLCDLGGCFLTNGWEREDRRRACDTFGFDWESTELLHEAVYRDFEKGLLTIDEYLTRTYFARPTTASRAEFVDFMKSCSHPMPESLAILAAFLRSMRVYCAAVNNESRELNDYRIGKFGLRRHFQSFFSSCYLGCRKPDLKIYEIALSVSAIPAAECLMIDDRPENLETARTVGMETHLYESPETLARVLMP